MQQRQLDAIAQQQLELGALAAGAEAFCARVRAGLATATFEQRRALVELLIDRVLVTDGEVEIRYVIPTSRDGPHQRFCQLRKDYRAVRGVAEAVARRRDAIRQTGAQLSGSSGHRRAAALADSVAPRLHDSLPVAQFNHVH